MNRGYPLQPLVELGDLGILLVRRGVDLWKFKSFRRRNTKKKKINSIIIFLEISNGSAVRNRLHFDPTAKRAFNQLCLSAKSAQEHRVWRLVWRLGKVQAAHTATQFLHMPLDIPTAEINQHSVWLLRSVPTLPAFSPFCIRTRQAYWQAYTRSSCLRVNNSCSIPLQF
jgi:hypothetical protein